MTMIETEPTTLLDILERHWGYTCFRPLQEEAMDAVLARRDSLVVMPTGAGKSICYQAPALLGKGLTVVVSPLISLMKDQVDGLLACGIQAAQLNSSLDSITQREIEKDVIDGKTKLLFVSPERLAVRSFRQLLTRVTVDSFAIDEAHCISHWGHDFRPEYRQLRGLRQEFPTASLHGYTATATEQVRHDIAQQLGLVDPLILVGNFDRPNLTYRIVRRSRELEQIEEVIARHKNEAGIVYCIRRRDVDEIAAALSKRGHNVAAYHAGLDPEQRKLAQGRFTSEKCDIVVATVAFGMGIDRSNVRFVMHVGMPKSIEHYQQETGRAGRDSLEAECVLLYSPADPVTWKTIMESSSAQSDPDAPSDHLAIAFRQLDLIRDYCAGGICRHRALVEYFGQEYESVKCDACDVCLDELEVVTDSKTIAQKILSCVVRLRDPFGAGYIASVLRGENLKKITERNHERLSTFGLLRDASKEELRDWIAQLTAQGILRQDGDRYPVLRLAEKARGVLSGADEVRLTRAAASESPRAKQKEASWEGVDRALFEVLRAWRRAEADSQGVPPFVIFNDATLRYIAAARPSELQRLRAVPGVGEVKLKDFGPTIIEILHDYAETSGVLLDQAPPVPRANTTLERAPRRVTAAMDHAFGLFAQGSSLDEVMESTQRARSTVSAYLADYISQERPESVAAWVPAARYSAIASAAARVGRDRLRPIRDELGEEYQWDEIRIVLAHLTSSGR